MTSAEPPLFPLVSGTIPGVIDHSQRERLLQSPSTALCFATFDALTARNNPNEVNPQLSARSHRHPSDGKRIVVETDFNTGICTWRFVPRAKLDPGVNDEGTWPRLVQLSGCVVRMTQDQWDIHKLDPEYECIVPAPPEITRVNRLLPAADASDIPPNTTSTHYPVPETPLASSAKMEGTTPTPKPRSGVFSSDGIRAPTFNNDSQSPSRMAVDTDSERHSFHFSPNQQTPQAPKVKRPRGTPSFRGKAKRTQASGSAEGLASSSGSETESGPTKKTRVRDPVAARRELFARRVERERKRKAQLDARLRARRDVLQNVFWEELGVPSELRDPTFFSERNSSEPDGGEENVFEAPSETTTEEENEDNEAIRQARIEESRRKLAELEKDKPLWEEAARRRKEETLREEEERRQRKIKREEEERQRAAYRRYREQWELEKQAHEREMKKKQKGSEMLVTSTRGGHRWSTGSALQRCIETAARFDSAKYSTSDPLNFQAIPWPMLQASFTINDIEWAAIEKFFKKAELYLPAKDFKDLVEKSHKRFHPDRWRSRRILLSVQDDLERDLLEVAGSTVAQALTPLWKKVTGRE